MKCERCKMRQIVPQDKGYKQDIVKAMASVEWCPACGRISYNFEDDEGRTTFADFSPSGIPKIRAISLYDDGETVVLLLDEGQDFKTLLRQWVALDDELGRTGEEPEGWLGFSDWMRSKGVKVIDHEVESINNFSGRIHQGD